MAGGYAWWYLDALSDDGRHGLTLIVFIGSVFSPYYAWARRRSAPADPTAHCAFNLALYRLGPGGHRRWTMTERGPGALARSAEALTLGPSRIGWTREGALQVTLDERGCPWPARCRGRLRVDPTSAALPLRALDDRGRHRWSPLAPRARITVALDAPRLQWSGHAYLDHNQGDAPLEQDLRRWDWSRLDQADGGCTLLYDVEPRDGPARSLALRLDRHGEASELPLPPRHGLPATGWRVPRSTHADAPPRVLRTLEDTPFYARSLIETSVQGEHGAAMHESLSLDRFASPWVQAMLPFRMPRRG